MINLKKFTGEFPRTNAYLIADHAAQYAVDCDFLAGSLRGAREHSIANGVGGTGIKSMYVFDGGPSSYGLYWWERDVDAVRSPVVNDTYNRFYWADGTGFYVSEGSAGANGPPDPTNQYKVGVPAPAAALTTTGALDIFADGTTITAQICDELSDGTFANCVDVTGTWTNTNTSEEFVTTAREAQAVGTATSTVTKSADSGDYVHGGIAQILVSGTELTAGSTENGTALDVQVYAKLGTNGFADAGTYVFYYKDALIQPSQIDAVYADTDYTFYQLGDTYWYGVNSSIVPPTNASESTDADSGGAASTATVSGSVCKLTITLSDGAVLTATVREDSSLTTWPAELPGYSAILVVSGTTYTVTISAIDSGIEHRAYTYTYVNQYGEEGPAALPLELDCATEASFDLVYAAPPADYCPITKIRVYRTATGTTTDYMFVGELTADPSLTFRDSVKTEELGETLSTRNYYPPDPTLVGICVMANGILAGFKGNEVWFSEPYLPYAWNPFTIKPFPHNVVGICPFEGGLYVTTTAEPYIVQGAAPEYMTDMRLPTIQAGVSKGSIVNYDGQIIYASHDGLVMLKGMSVSMDFSFNFFTRKEWLDRYGSKLNQMRLNAHDGSLVAWFEDGTAGFVIRFEEEAASMSRSTDTITAAFKHPATDALYISDGASVYSYRTSASRKALTWWSKEFTAPRPINFGVMQFVGTGSITLYVYADYTLISTQSVSLSTAGTTVRLPSGFRARNWSFKIEGSTDLELEEVSLGISPSELQGV